MLKRFAPAIGLLILLASGFTSRAIAAVPDPKQTELARMVLIASGNGPRVDTVQRAAGTRDRLAAALGAANPSLDLHSPTAIAAMDKEIEYERAQFFSENLKIYETRFSQAELTDMLAFYRSPGGTALVRQTPDIVKDKVEWARQLGSHALERMMKNLR